MFKLFKKNTNKIKTLKGYQILDSRGNPTIEVELVLENRIKVWSSVPSGASTGKYEAVELRDQDSKDFGGKGVTQAIKNIEQKIFPAIKDINITNQKQIDIAMLKLDGTKNKSSLGANAILAVSEAVCRAGAIVSKKPLYKYIAEISENKNSLFCPRPFFNIVNGGVHAGSQIATQEFMVSPAFETFEENYKAAAEIYQVLKKILKEKFGQNSELLGDEGGFAPVDFKNEKEVLETIKEAVKKAGYEGKTDFALDVAASEFYQNLKYNLGFKKPKDEIKTSEEMITFYKKLKQDFPNLISIEDPFDQTDFLAFAKLKREFQNQVQIVADDLTVTNTTRIQKAIDHKSANALLLKVNQIGTITESIEAFKLAKQNEWKVMVSHRSGETTDDFIADFAVGVGADQIKSGATARGERVVKYNRLLYIEKAIKIS
ncbi:phosphopyruvate hydratase [Candidatus Campbellbacteria bacterium]|nr:MAG: phosphopyruvate hydratase [Candidatus Campbellbacteria bacterium]